MRHSIALWTELSRCDVMFTEHKSAYSGFVALVNRLPAVFVDKKNDVRLGAELWLYTAEQRVEYDVPRVNFNARKVKKSELVATDGGLALVGEEFADHNKGWALVLVDSDRCSTQGIVTQCTLYEQYTSQEALLAAAKSHSNRKMKIELPPTL